MKYYLHVLKNYATFQGRARRSEYWYFVLFNAIISYSLLFIGLSAGNGLETLNSIYSLVVFVPSIAVAVRRAHDVGKSGWYMLIPIYNLVLAATDGEPNSNEYGEDPKGRGSSAQFENFGQQETEENFE